MTEQHDYREISDPAVMAVQPLVSVHMLAYRHERFLAEAIEGVVAQVCDFPIELIIAEDCSPDGTLGIALDYQLRYPHLIRIITGDRNVGMHANATRSGPAARGKYIAFCEGDDYWHYPHKLQAQVDVMSDSPDITLCHTDYNRQIGRRIKTSRYKSGVDKPARSYLDALHGMTIKTATCLYKKSTLVGYGESLIHNTKWPFGDYSLELFATATGQLAYMPISTATSRKVFGSATNSGAVAALHMAIAGKECRELFMKRFPVSAEDVESVRRTTYKQLIGSSLRAGDAELFSKSLKEFKANGGRMGGTRQVILRQIALARFPLQIYRAIQNTVVRISTR